MPAQAGKALQTDPGASGCAWADDERLPMLRACGRCVDPEQFDPGGNEETVGARTGRSGRRGDGRTRAGPQTVPHTAFVGSATASASANTDRGALPSALLLIVTCTGQPAAAVARMTRASAWRVSGSGSRICR